ncbi:MAG: nucleotide pyrophosphohydrolase [Candidatus Bathyarchaeota archaeon]|nr:MAG: nucleotide pyrophosphohydrolase [Candidatus Bathyarchaeota archaeon]
MKDFQQLMSQIYLQRDLKRGKERTFMWLVEEVGELSDSMLRGDQKQIEEEISDVFAWLASLCNVLNVDLEEVVLKKYNKVCPRCSESPCSCSLQ